MARETPPPIERSESSLETTASRVSFETRSSMVSVVKRISTELTRRSFCRLVGFLPIFLVPRGRTPWTRLLRALALRPQRPRLPTSADRLTRTPEWLGGSWACARNYTPVPQLADVPRPPQARGRRSQAPHGDSERHSVLVHRFWTLENGIFGVESSRCRRFKNHRTSTPSRKNTVGDSPPGSIRRRRGLVPGRRAGGGGGVWPARRRRRTGLDRPRCRDVPGTGGPRAACRRS